MSQAGSSAAFKALLKRDLVLAYRRRSEMMQPLIFALVVVSLFPLGVGPSPQLLATIAPGVIWMAGCNSKNFGQTMVIKEMLSAFRRFYPMAQL